VRTNGFPDGTFHLKLFRWKDQTFFDLFKSPEEYKLATIEPIFKEFPHRKFVLVGDSSEKDLEIYAALARKFPDQIAHIFIRDTTGESRNSIRYQTAFAGVGSDVWQIFRKPGELPTRPVISDQ
jgi:phosphatidate phosphatase APP1